MGATTSPTPMPRRANAVAGQAPPHANDGVLGKFNRHRQFNSPISRDLMLDAGTRDIGRRIANCAHTIKADVLLHPELEPEVNLKAAHVCNTRLCPFCEWRRTRVWRKRLYDGLSALYEDKPKLRGVFLTLTVRNVPLGQLGEQLDEMNKSWNRFVQRAFFPTDFWFRRTEITVGYSSGMSAAFAHPHFHALLLVPPGYFGKNYIKQLEWQKQWMESARLDYVPVVDVRSAKQKSGAGSSSSEDAKSAVVEAAKYASKATALMELGSDISELHWQLKNRRLYAVSKELNKYIKSGDISPEELMDNDAKPLPEGTERVEVMAQWFADTNEYLITDVLTP